MTSIHTDDGLQGAPVIETVTSRGRVRKAKAINFGDSDDDFEDDDDFSDDDAMRRKKKGAGRAGPAGQGQQQQQAWGGIIEPPQPSNEPLEFTVEKILSWQPYTEEEHQEVAAGQGEAAAAAAAAAKEKDYWLVKWKGRSYLHVSWETRGGLLMHDPMTDQKIKRFEQSMLKSKGPHWKDVMEEEMKERKGPELPEPEFTEVHRVIACETPFVNIGVVARQLRRQRHALWLDEQAIGLLGPVSASPPLPSLPPFLLSLPPSLLLLLEGEP